MGARDGAADTALAIEAAATADLALWVVTSDGLQQATVDPVRQILSRGVPVLVALNHKEQHDLREDHVWSSESLLTDRGARDRRVRDVLAGTVGATVEVVHVQLDVARWARADVGRKAAWVAAGLPVLERSLKAAAGQAQAGRTATRRAHQAAASLVAVKCALRQLRAALQESLTVQDAAIAQSHERLAAGQVNWQQGMDAARTQALSLVSAQCDAAVRLAQAKEHRGEATTAWCEALQSLDEEVTALLNTAAQSGLRAQRAHGDEPLVLAAAGFDVPPLELKGDPLTARGSRATLNVVKVAVGAVPFFILGPFGAAVIAVVAPLVTEAFAGDAVPQLDDEQRKRAQSLVEARNRAEPALRHRVEGLRSAADTVYAARVTRLARLEAVGLTARRMQLERQRVAVARACEAVEEALDDH